MREPLLISSSANPKIKRCIHLRKKRERDRSSLFLIEGYRELLRATEGKLEVEELFISPEHFLGENEGELISKIEKKGAKIYRCDPKVFEKISYRDRPDGLLAVAKQPKKELKDLPLSKIPFLVIAESIEKPGNLGTILRSSDAAGVDGCIVCDPCTDVYNPNVVRSSVGTLFTVPVVQATTEETLAYLRDQGIQILAATPHTENFHHQVDLKKPVALVLGTEQVGLSKTWMDEADLKVKIPMLGTADSLNVAMAATVLLYEVVRQRMG